ncbi:MAG TPA: glycosyltransferase family 39 protein [Acidisarcina sp.]|nr:glycosyltransferase family 39 protein [Acidisarcina sp.]
MSKHSSSAEYTELSKPLARLSPLQSWAILLLFYFAIHVAALFSPSLLDDADATHANAAQAMAQSGDWVTLKVNGLRYLEKPPLPYWVVAANYHLFGQNVFSTHLPLSLAVLGCAILAWVWARRAYSDRAGFYAALGVLTSLGVFLFTRIFIPEVLLTFFLGLALYFFLTGMEDRKPSRIYGMWAVLGLAILTKGLIAPVFFFAAIVPYLVLTGQWRRWRELRLVTGGLLFLAIAAPWHVLAGLRNPDHGNPIGNIPTPGNVHGFFYFYFYNEHVLRFLGKRYPHDYNKLPTFLFWALHLVWLFPWSLYAPVALRRAWRTRHSWLELLRPAPAQTVDFYLGAALTFDPAAISAERKFRARTNWLLCIYAAVILIFFSLSTNQEYYTFPAYLPLLIMTAGVLAGVELRSSSDQAPDFYDAGALRWLDAAQAVFAVLGIAAAAALGYGLWESRNLPFVSDIGTLLAHRGVGNYSLSMSHFFDLTGPSFAALRLPAILAALAFLFGPVIALIYRRRRKHLAATLSVAITSAVFLIAAHIALHRFEPMLSSRAIADTMNRLSAPQDQFLIYADQSDASSVIFYTHRQALLVEGRTTSMLWGSCYPDAPKIFLKDADLVRDWGQGERKWLFVPGHSHQHVRDLLGNRLILVQELSDKTLYTDRPLTK